MHEALSPPPSPVTIRNRGFVLVCGIILLMALGFASMLVFAPGGVAADEGALPGEAWVVFVVVGLFGAFSYVLGVHPLVRLSEEGLELRGVLTTAFVPWAEVETLDAEGRGRFVVGLPDDRETREGTAPEATFEGGGRRAADHFHYGQSLGGDLIRYRHHRRVVRRIEAFRERIGEGAATGRASEIVFTPPVLPALWAFLACQVPLAAGFVLSLFAG
ncbi:PH domain-containing protein [Nocardiopsis ganjiahuensis]|uniref:PH domain-containing protein n=1 Tax=Nocardiopsis ganjiahuensis TaxID=239984 RepID=UPI000346809D|nr:PH domain-containing protein [Nocardiopsis ganjiahuensis]